MDDRGRVPKRLASRKEISNLLAAKETESKVNEQTQDRTERQMEGRGGHTRNIILAVKARCNKMAAYRLPWPPHVYPGG